MSLWPDPTEGRARFTPPAWFVLAACPLLSLLAVVWHGPASMPSLAVAEGVLLALSRPKARQIRRLVLVCIWQTALVVGLYALRFGPQEWRAGLEVSARLILVFLPGMLTVSMVPPTELERILRRILPGNLAFVAACCLRFFPLLLTRIRIIHEAQVLRGAKVLPRELLSPRNWPDAVCCIGFPAVVQCIELATEIADSARVRGFDMQGSRTAWPLDEEQRRTEAATTAKEQS